MNYLIVVAHPDDEVLGAGATMFRLAKEGHKINVCIMASQANARAFRPEDNELAEDTKKCLNMLGVGKTFEGSFPNIELNTVPHLKLVQFIEKAIIESQAEVVITHHSADTNNDHLHTSLACQAAVRLFQRRDDVKPLQKLMFMEVLSSSEWNVNRALNPFNPNIFIEIGEDGINKKIEALAQYRGVMRDYPHPRSAEALKGLAAYRGAQAGLNYAEGFECVFERVVF